MYQYLEDEAGSQAKAFQGYLVGAFSLGQVIGSPFWGVMSTRVNYLVRVSRPAPALPAGYARTHARMHTHAHLPPIACYFSITPFPPLIAFSCCCEHYLLSSHLLSSPTHNVWVSSGSENRQPKPSLQTVFIISTLFRTAGFLMYALTHSFNPTKGGHNATDVSGFGPYAATHYEKYALGDWMLGGGDSDNGMTYGQRDKEYWMVASRLITGFGAGCMAVCSAYVAGSTTMEVRILADCFVFLLWFFMSTFPSGLSLLPYTPLPSIGYGCTR
jgi:MFS family permease